MWQSRQVPERGQQADGEEDVSWEALVRRHCCGYKQALIRDSVSECSTLAVFSQLSSFGGVEEWLRSEVTHPGKSLKIRLRAGCLPLMVHVGVRNLLKRRSMRQCVMCDTGAVETEEHFVDDCPFYSDLRDRCVERLRELLLSVGMRDFPPTATFFGLVAGSASALAPSEVRLRVEKCAWDYLRLAWRRRQQVWERVCLNGDPWRLSGPS